jgi:hypothetical protein
MAHELTPHIRQVAQLEVRVLERGDVVLQYKFAPPVSPNSRGSARDNTPALPLLRGGGWPAKSQRPQESKLVQKNWWAIHTPWSPDPGHRARARRSASGSRTRAPPCARSRRCCTCPHAGPRHRAPRTREPAPVPPRAAPAAGEGITRGGSHESIGREADGVGAVRHTPLSQKCRI